MSKFKCELFDAVVGGNVYEETFDTSHAALDWIYSVIDGYECEENFADDRELRESAAWQGCFLRDMKQRLFSAVQSIFLDSISFWLPGHHRKITITQIEENI